MLLVSQGVVQNFDAYDSATLVDKTITVESDVKDADDNVMTDAAVENVKETITVTTQTIAQCPVASQEAIKMWERTAVDSTPTLRILLKIEYRGAVFEEMDLAAIIERKSLSHFKSYLPRTFGVSS